MRSEAARASHRSYWLLSLVPLVLLAGLWMLLSDARREPSSTEEDEALLIISQMERAMPPDLGGMEGFALEHPSIRVRIGAVQSLGRVGSTADYATKMHLQDTLLTAADLPNLPTAIQMRVWLDGDMAANAFPVYVDTALMALGPETYGRLEQVWIQHRYSPRQCEALRLVMLSVIGDQVHSTTCGDY